MRIGTNRLCCVSSTPGIHECGLANDRPTQGRAFHLQGFYPARMPRLKIKVQLLAGDAIAIGPGKAELLEWLQRTGSISGAAKGMGLSYRRAWLMIDTMNRAFAEPLVTTSHGGAHGGGAMVTPAG